MYKSQDPAFMKAKYAEMLSALTLQPEETISSEEPELPTETTQSERQSESKKVSSTETTQQDFS